MAIAWLIGVLSDQLHQLNPFSIERYTIDERLNFRLRFFWPIGNERDTSLSSGRLLSHAFLLIKPRKVPVGPLVNRIFPVFRRRKRLEHASRKIERSGHVLMNAGTIEFICAASLY
jgi:hypothetical protein